MGIERHDEDAYGRVTNPERYRAVVESARELIGALLEAHEAHATSGTAAADFPEWPDGGCETINVVPAAGAPLVVLITGLPGIIARCGEWTQVSFPECGCDACDEQPVEVIERLRRLIDATVSGRFAEELTRHELRHRFHGEWGHKSSRRRLTRRDRRRLGRPRTHHWPPWPARSAG
jgi:hypothetical protein